MEDEKSEVFANVEVEKEKEIKFSKGFKWILGISIFLTGFLAIPGMIFTIDSIGKGEWSEHGITNDLYKILMTISLFMCFCMLVSIARTKKPFSIILIKTTKCLAWLFFAAAIMFPRFSGYRCNFQLWGGLIYIGGWLAFYDWNAYYVICKTNGIWFQIPE